MKQCGIGLVVCLIGGAWLNGFGAPEGDAEDKAAPDPVEALVEEGRYSEAEAYLAAAVAESAATGASNRLSTSTGSSGWPTFI